MFEDKDVICITNIYQFSSTSKTYDELIINKKYNVRVVKEQPNSNRHNFYKINNKYYRCEMFKFLEDIREEKLKLLIN